MFDYGETAFVLGIEPAGQDDSGVVQFVLTWRIRVAPVGR